MQVQPHRGLWREGGLTTISCIAEASGKHKIWESGNKGKKNESIDNRKQVLEQLEAYE